MTHYVVNMNDGSVTILNLIDSRFSVEDEINKWSEDERTQVSSYYAIQQSDIPTDRSFRFAWTYDQNTGFGHDMNKAKEAFKNKIRVVRAPLLEKLDIEYSKADEVGNTDLKRAVADKKQLLRDITASSEIANATNVTELKLSWNTSLLGSNPYQTITALTK